MKILKIRLKTQKLEELKSFYIHKLRFEPLVDEKNYFSFQAGASILEFEKDQSDASAPNYHFAFNIPKNLLKEAKNWLYAQNLSLLAQDGNDTIDFPNWNAKALYFIDPADNIVEFIARYDLDNELPGPFTAQSICEISEIGLPVPSVKAMYEILLQEFELPVYSHISNMETFCAAGDPQGLLIIVSLERPWFLTNTLNGTYPTEIVVEGKYNHQKSLNHLPYRIESVSHKS